MRYIYICIIKSEDLCGEKSIYFLLFFPLNFCKWAACVWQKEEESCKLHIWIESYGWILTECTVIGIAKKGHVGNEIPPF